MKMRYNDIVLLRKNLLRRNRWNNSRYDNTRCMCLYTIFATYISLAFWKNFEAFFKTSLNKWHSWDLTFREFDELNFKIISVGLFLTQCEIHFILVEVPFNYSRYSMPKVRRVATGNVFSEISIQRKDNFILSQESWAERKSANFWCTLYICDLFIPFIRGPRPSFRCVGKRPLCYIPQRRKKIRIWIHSRDGIGRQRPSGLANVWFNLIC